MKPLFCQFPVCMLSRIQLFATLWTVVCQAPLSMEFSRQEYWSGLLCPSPGDLPNTGIKTQSPALQVDFLPAELPGKPILGLHLINYKLLRNNIFYKLPLFHNNKRDHWHRHPEIIHISNLSERFPY